jgi:hypothetical protein
VATVRCSTKPARSEHEKLIWLIEWGRMLTMLLWRLVLIFYPWLAAGVSGFA